MTTTALTVIGGAMATATAIGDFLVHTNMEGGALKQPTFWLGLLVAALMAVKGYLAQGIPPVGQEVVTKPAETPKP